MKSIVALMRIHVTKSFIKGKFTTQDKKMYKELNETKEVSDDEYTNTALGDFTKSSVKRLYSYLTGTLNLAFPDYIFK